MTATPDFATADLDAQAVTPPGRGTTAAFDTTELVTRGIGARSAGADSPAPASPDLLRAVFRQHAAGVAVITARGESPVGFTATSLTSVAAEPPLVSFGIGAGSSSWPVIAKTDHVGVHILAEQQRELAETFARRGADRFGPATSWRSGPREVPLLDGVNAWLVCRIVARVPAGDHRLVLAQVETGGHTSAGRPLLYHRGRFNALRD